MRNLTVGGLYFRIWYRDREEKSPEPKRFFLDLDSFVFIGKDLESANDGRVTWYFQDPYSYCARGAFPNLDNAEDPEAEPFYLFRLHEEELDQVRDCKCFAKEVLECLERRVSGGMPA
jgi:hypothetical protein